MTTIYTTLSSPWYFNNQYILYRHPTTAHRPGFRSILLTLMEKEETVLNVPSDAGSEQLAAVLGAPLEAGFNMYSQLQTVYCADYALLD